MNAAPRSRVVDAGVLLVGDAAGVADSQSGEGIRQAVESGLLAARTIVESGKLSDYGTPRAQHHLRNWAETYGKQRGGTTPARPEGEGGREGERRP